MKKLSDIGLNFKTVGDKDRCHILCIYSTDKILSSIIKVDDLATPKVTLVLKIAVLIRVLRIHLGVCLAVLD